MWLDNSRFLINGRVVDLKRGWVTDATGASITLRPKVSQTLKLLASRPNELVSKEELLHTVWGNVNVGDDSLVQSITEIRKAIGDKKRRIIRNQQKRGYVLDIQAANHRLAIMPMRRSWLALATTSLLILVSSPLSFWPTSNLTSEENLFSDVKRAYHLLKQDLLIARQHIDDRMTLMEGAVEGRPSAILQSKAQAAGAPPQPEVPVTATARIEPKAETRKVRKVDKPRNRVVARKQRADVADVSLPAGLLPSQ